MITEAILNVVFSLFIGLFSLVPDLSMPADVLSALTQAFAWAGWVDYYIPMGTALTAILLVITSWAPAAVIHFILNLF